MKNKVLNWVFVVAMGFSAVIGAMMWDTDSTVASAETPASTISLGDTLLKSISPTDETMVYATKQTNEDGIDRLAESDFVEYAVHYAIDIRETYFFANVAGDFALSVSADQESYTTLENAKNEFGADFIEGNGYYYDLSDYFYPGETLLVRITAKENGCLISGLAFSARKNYQAYEAKAGEDCEIQYSLTANSEYIVEESSRYGEAEALDSVFCDLDNAAVYRFPLKKADALGLEVVVYACAGYRISVSSDNKTWTDLDISEMKYYRYDSSYYNDGGNYGSYAFDVSYLLENDANYVYVRLGDSSTWTGFGGQYYWLALKEFYETTESKLSVVEENKLINEVQLAANRYLEENNGSVADGAWRKIKGEEYFVYRLDLPETTTSLALAMAVGNSLNLYVSHDGSDYTLVPKSTFVSGSEYLDGTSYTADFSKYLDGGKTIYLKFTDGNPTDDEYFVLKRFFVLYNDSALENVNKKNYATEKYSIFTDITVDEQNYLQDIGKYASHDHFKRVLDRCYAIYKFDYKAGYDGLKLIGVLRGSYYLQVSLDGTTWQDVAVCDVPVVAGSANMSRELNTDLSDYVRLDRDGSIWVKVSDAIDDNGFGGEIKGLGIMQYSGAEIVFETNEKDFPAADLTTVEPVAGGCGSTVSLSVGSVLIVSAMAVIVLKRVKKDED